MKPLKFITLCLLLTSASPSVLAESGASIEEGKKLFYLERVTSKGEKMSCTVCHTDNPKQSGKSRANKVIEPLAPVANPKRFTDQAKIEKWFKRNCQDVLERQCTSAEKESFVMYMKSIK
ncbi:MAG: hypothetical protein FMNOHCHN_03607 [Ignavibacteriaceae bacterium]|nr:hypothetical protein [Ignavibacteriaceae bacterium]GIL17939.1 MAG: hypothetical protein BroJett040_16900 [Oligoflexia bacterium]